MKEEQKPHSRIHFLNEAATKLDNSISTFRDYNALYPHDATIAVIYSAMREYAKQETKNLKQQNEEMTAKLEKERKDKEALIKLLKNIQGVMMTDILYNNYLSKIGITI